MDPSLTWEILSRISSSTTASSDRGAASDDDDDLPFFAQRGGEGGCHRDRRTITSSLFVTACPIARGDDRVCSSSSASADDRPLLPALYSRDVIAVEYARIVRLHFGRPSSAEVAAWLGVGEDEASDLIDQQSPDDTMTAAPKTDGQSSEVSDRRLDEEDRARSLRRRVLGGLSGATVPTSLERRNGKDDDWSREDADQTIISIAKSLCEKGMLRGTLITPSSSSTVTTTQKSPLTNAIYTPHIYSRTQRKIADSFYKTNGYLTEKKWVALGLSRSRIEKFVAESFPKPKAVLLTNSIIDADRICRPLEIAVQHALLNKGFADLRSELPSDIASCEEDVKEIIGNHLVDCLKEQPHVHTSFEGGIVVVNGKMALFFCGDMIATCKQLLMPLVEEYSKQRAKEIVDDSTAKVGLSAAVKKKETHIRQTSNSAKEQDLVPLSVVARGIRVKYPELFDLQHQYNPDLNMNDDGDMTLSWEADNDTNDDGPLVELCRCALFSDELQRVCARSVKAEVDRLNSTRLGVSVSARVEGAAKMQHIGEAFESSFRVLCHLLQLFAKSLDALGSRAQQGEMDTNMSAMVIIMKRELLLGCGSCLARLVTEYYLFRNAEAHCLYFESYQGAESTSEKYFQAVCMEALNFPFFVLKCRSGNDCPLKYLRSAFPGGAGSNLAQMWSLCSDDGQGDSSGNHTSGKKLESFVNHLVDNCLSLVGTPFAILNKKTERKITDARRDGILDRLERSQDREEVVMCVVVLICYQVRNLSIAGYETIDSMLKLFEHDTKIPNQVADTMQGLKSTDASETTNLIARVKRFGLAKNSKALAALVES